MTASSQSVPACIGKTTKTFYNLNFMSFALTSPVSVASVYKTDTTNQFPDEKLVINPIG